MAHTDIIRKQYRIVSQEWHSTLSLTPERDSIVDIVEFGHYHDDGSTDGATQVKWRRFDTGDVMAQVASYADDWKFLARETQLVVALGDLDPRITPQEFARFLTRFGYSDATERTRPAQRYGYGGTR